ncbi:MAG: GAF domain-containing protein [Anaerolineae bacterium]|jgi:GAF domain-containing protein/HAMP domain-containing protein|nr:GAF domain-containing protein [Anaerolineae bacterium]MBT7783074.1 GAF domain-containing protein [Anaerolineae bacterium]
MNNPTEKKSIYFRILQRTGGVYLIFAVFITQFLSLFGALAAGYSIQLNAEFKADALASVTKFAITSFFLTNFFVLIIIYFLYRDVQKKLNNWQKNKKTASELRDDIKIWNKITSFAWRYSLIFLVTNILVTIIPEALYQINELGLNADQVIYTLLGNSAAVLGNSALSLLLLDYFLKPTYAILMPVNTEGLHIRTRGAGISIKLQSVTLALILTSILFVAPIGYHQTAKALETHNPAVLEIMQIQSLIVAILTIFFGILLSALFAHSVSNPLEKLIQTFNKIEAGDLEERALVTAPDEIGELAIYFNSMVSRLDELQSHLEAEIETRTEHIKASSEVGRAVSSILDPEELIEKIVSLITERLGYYYAAIFIISPDGSWAELKGATGEAGLALKAKKHRLSLAGESMVGSAISSRETHIAHDVGNEAARFDNPLLPHTRSEIALPLIAGGHVLGALNAQSTEENAFSEDVAEILQGMARQVAIALENARLFQETQQTLREIRSSQQAQLSADWTDVLESQGELEFSTGRKSSPENPLLNIPLALRDQVIGNIMIEGNAEWAAEDEDWIEAVATQAAIALENARLLEESQQVALQERLVAEITSKIWSSNTIDGILKVTIKELGNALGASEAIIELNTNDKQEA